MQFDSLNDFLAMGGYAFYVWWSYAITIVVLGLNIVVPRLQMRALRARIAREQRLTQRAPPPTNPNSNP